VFSRLTGCAALCFLVACGRSSATTPAAHRPVHIDSLVPRAEALRRFRSGTPRVDSLSGGVTSRDALVRGYVRAIEQRDTLVLRRLLLTRSEFAYLYYPTNPQGLPPYDLSPDLMWFMLSAGSEKGLTRVLAELGGQRLGYTGYVCDSVASRQGANTVWGPCAVHLRPKGGDSTSQRLFGLIVERDGRYKFVSYANKI
jgi:hypothetical protein